ncbi:MAG: lantibiotic dehydratase family protein [Bacteroidales bacterium]|jgi:6-pyruvoyl-tetrahydropterin synthase|nr:lantibiotic dehydratase family protein [Bacteroidales bacterium]
METNNGIEKNLSYIPFSSFTFRTPFYSFQEFQENIKRLEQNEDYWNEFLQNLCLQEAIFLGSPILYEEIQKYLSGKLSVEKEIEKMKMAVLRYYTRMSTRCTPFGLFAGFSMGQFDEISEIELSDSSQYSRYTRLDMNYLCNLAQDIAKLPNVKSHLKYYPNSSLYLLGDKLRYVEYYFQNTKRIHHITAVDSSEYLDRILEKAQLGSSIEELAVLLVDEEINIEEATEFIYELIDNQILISELEPAITGKDFLYQLMSVLNVIPGNEILKTRLSSLSSLLLKIDSIKIGTTLSVYSEIKKVVKELATAYDDKFLFQTDMFKPVKKAVLSKKIIQNIQEALELTNKLSLPLQETALSKFAKSYYERYGEKESPLLQVLDTETGIGYQQDFGDTSASLRGYFFPDQQNANRDVKWNRIQSVLHKKFLSAYKNNAYSVIIEDKDFDFLTTNWDDLPPTMSNMCEIFSNKKDESLIYVHNAGGSSAVNLLGRFCHVNEMLENYANEITAYEQSLNSDIIYAEIVHLPESRLGNILLRPVLRPYEIPYLGKSSADEDHQILLSDLYVSVRGSKVSLRSKRLNKQIIPRLATAHNYRFNSMPVYHFLCDMQTQGLRGGIGFSWGTLSNEYDFLPRALYKNVILSLAKWSIQMDDFKKTISVDKRGEIDKNMILKNIEVWRNDKQIPRYVVLPDADNTLFVDLENSLSIQMLYSAIKNRTSFQLEEFPCDPENALVRDEQGNSFTNEFVFGFYKTNENGE